MATNPVIVLEFNELTPSLIDRFAAEGDLPNFTKLKQQSHVFTTEAEERAPDLEPWIQWVTVHSGLTYKEHGVFHLNEGHKLSVKRTWETIAEAGHTSWICGSMNIGQSDAPNVMLLPDPWCTKVKPNPAELELYFRFVQQNVLEHTNTNIPLSLADYASFLGFMVRKGLSAGTVMAIARQLLAEQTSDCRWQRVVLLDLLQFDVFAHYYRKLTPAFSTFFLNSTAHYQHAYWDSMEPEKFSVLPGNGAAQKYRDAIRFGYQKMDVMLDRMMRLADQSSATLVLCTALSQQPSPDYDQNDGAAFYRPRRFEDFATAIGLRGRYSIQPVMSEQFHLEFADPAEAAAAAAHLTTVLMGGAPMLSVEHTATRIFVGCSLHHDVADEAQMSVGGRTLRFGDLFYKMDTGKTGMHHPDGILWIRRPDHRHQTTTAKVPLTAVAPTLLNLLSVPAPSHMTTAALPV
jgi:hypothetical protein